MGDREDMSRKAIEVSSLELNALLRSGSRPVLLYVWAPWCPPCKTMTPAMDEVAAQIGDEVRVVKMNAATESQTLTAFNIASVPSLLLFSTLGEERARLLGSFGPSRVLEWIAKNRE